MRPLVVAFVLITMAARLAAAQPQPAPPYPPPPPPPPPAYRVLRPPPPPPPVVAPPPLSPLMRVIYAPFYAAGLVVRYGVYYLIVAPFEVFDRAVSYGAQGGVERQPPPKPPEDQP